MNRFPTVFSFTFHQQTCTKGWRVMTVLMALILFLLPALLPTLIDQTGDKEPPVCHAARLMVVDQTPGDVDWSMLNQMGDLQLEYILCDDLDTASAQAGDDGLIAVLSDYEGNYDLTVLCPDEGPMTFDDADACANFLTDGFQLILLQKAGMTLEQAAMLAVPVTVDSGDEQDTIRTEEIRDLMGELLPYCTVLLVYFMVLIYGQSVASSAVSEKTSKLMDTFLVSVRPEAMMLGKMLAISLAAILQLGVWLLALIGGCAAGAEILRSVNPDSTSGFLMLIDGIGTLGGLFTPASIAVAVAIMLSGFLLYCSLAAVGGAMASKPEELPTTNVMFTLALIVSFFACFYGGGMMSPDGITLSWVDWVPFTAILATPSRVLLGQITPLTGLLSLALVLIVSLLMCLLAGRVYRMMSFYRGAPPTPKRVLEMLRNR